MKIHWGLTKQAWSALDDPKFDKRKDDDCPACRGTGRHHQCNGDGCMDCKPAYSGNCPYCLGSGQR